MVYAKMFYGGMAPPSTRIGLLAITTKTGSWIVIMSLSKYLDQGCGFLHRCLMVGAGLEKSIVIDIRLKCNDGI